MPLLSFELRFIVYCFLPNALWRILGAPCGVMLCCFLPNAFYARSRCFFFILHPLLYEIDPEIHFVGRPIAEALDATDAQCKTRSNTPAPLSAPAQFHRHAGRCPRTSRYATTTRRTHYRSNVLCRPCSRARPAGVRLVVASEFDF